MKLIDHMIRKFSKFLHISEINAVGCDFLMDPLFLLIIIVERNFSLKSLPWRHLSRDMSRDSFFQLKFKSCPYSLWAQTFLIQKRTSQTSWTCVRSFPKFWRISEIEGFETFSGSCFSVHTIQTTEHILTFYNYSTEKLKPIFRKKWNRRIENTEWSNCTTLVW